MSALELLARPEVEAFSPGSIVFQNPGLIDIAAVTTMGVSVKDGDGAIGYFGTGLKFAIATILRGGGRVSIYRGFDAYHFGVKATEVRGQSFDLVTMNGEALGFTTQLGRTWEPWMAFRELASNCRDESGFYTTSAIDPREDHTTIVATGLADVWHERETILLEREPLATMPTAEIHEGPSIYVYYRGVRVHRLNRPSAHLYNIRSKIELTEDRTAKSWYEVEIAIERAIGALDDKHLLRTALTCGEQYTEHHMDVPRFGSPGAAFREMARELTMGSATVPNVNPAAAASARAMAMSDIQPGQSVALEQFQQAMLDRAKAMLCASGFNITAFDTVVMDTLGPNICGMAHDGRIFLSLLPFQKGTREVAATLLEEYAHLKSGAADCTREFQNWMFDQLLVQAERIAREPF